MYDWINWKGIRSYWNVYKYTRWLFAVSLSIFILLIKFQNRPVDIISISIGLSGLIAAVYSIESTTLQLKDIQTDYWNVRGLDLGKQRDYHNALQAFDKAIRIDPQSIKCLINKANVLLEKGKKYGDELSFIEAIRVIEQAIHLGPKYPASLKKETPEESKALQEYANALKTECDILLEQANTITRNKFKDELRAQAAKVIARSIDKYNAIDKSKPNNRYPRQNPELIGALISRGNVIFHTCNAKRALIAYNNAIDLDPSEAHTLAW
jgi:tetratricopeptide (TPR) repeat protein